MGGPSERSFTTIELATLDQFSFFYDEKEYPDDPAGSGGPLTVALIAQNGVKRVCFSKRFKDRI